MYEVRSFIDRQGRVPSDAFYRYDDHNRDPSHPDWDVTSAGTSEEIFGIRYGRLADPSITSIYQAQQLGSKLVEVSAWPQTTYTVEAMDLGDIPTVTSVGDLIAVRYNNEDVRERIVEMTTDISAPRALRLVLGEDPATAASKIERLAKDIETTISSLNSATGSADA